MTRLTCVDPPDPPIALAAWLTLVRQARFSAGLRCPRCGAVQVQRWGSFSGRQRYRCRGSCGRTFSDLTGTPAAYIKKLDHWPRYQRFMREGTSLRRAAEELNVHVSTAFRWRHRLLAYLSREAQPTLEGYVELGLVRFPESRKGCRSLGRPARRRATSAYEWWTGPRANVLLMVDRAGRATSLMLPPSDPGPCDRSIVDGIRGSRLATRWTGFTGQGWHSIWARVTARLEFVAMDARPSAGATDRAQHVGAYRLRLKRWMGRFRGVATKYLEHYVAWHRRADRAVREDVAEALVRWPVALE